VEYRLPEGAVEVTIYDVHLTLDKDVFQTNKFSGVSSVLFKNMKETNEIKIHANRLTFSEILLVAQNGQSISLENEGNLEIDECYRYFDSNNEHTSCPRGELSTSIQLHGRAEDR
jgi:aminopeptidase N